MRVVQKYFEDAICGLKTKKSSRLAAALYTHQGFAVIRRDASTAAQQNKRQHDRPRLRGRLLGGLAQNQTWAGQRLRDK